MSLVFWVREQFSSDYDYLKHKHKVIDYEHEFKSKLKDFIDAFIREYELDNKSLDKIIFIIDDLDLCSSKTQELLNILLRYINHPRVMTIVSVDIDALEFNLTAELIKQDGMIDYKVFENTQGENKTYVYNKKKRLAYDTIKKVLPPQHRYSLKVWKLSDKMSFTSLQSQKIEGKERSLGELVYALQGMDTFVKRMECDDIKQLYLIFDDTPRGLESVYSKLMQFSNRNISKDHKWIIIEALIDANPDLVIHKDLLLNKIIKYIAKQEKLDIDFEAFYSEMKIDKKMFEKYSPRSKVRIFTLVDFVIKLFEELQIMSSTEYRDVLRYVENLIVIYKYISDNSGVQQIFWGNANRDNIEFYAMRIRENYLDDNDKYQELDNSKLLEFFRSSGYYGFLSNYNKLPNYCNNTNNFINYYREYLQLLKYQVDTNEMQNWSMIKYFELFNIEKYINRNVGVKIKIPTDYKLQSVDSMMQYASWIIERDRAKETEESAILDVIFKILRKNMTRYSRRKKSNQLESRNFEYVNKDLQEKVTKVLEEKVRMYYIKRAESMECDNLAEQDLEEYEENIILKEVELLKRDEDASKDPQSNNCLEIYVTLYIIDILQEYASLWKFLAMKPQIEKERMYENSEEKYRLQLYDIDINDLRQKKAVEYILGDRYE